MFVNMENDKPNKIKPGQKPHVPTDEQRQSVSLMTVAGATQEMVARVLKIDRNTLAKYYRDELDLAKAKANMMVAKSLYQKAVDGDTAAMIWWTKAQMRWSEKLETENTHNIKKIEIEFIED